MVKHCHTVTQTSEQLLFSLQQFFKFLQKMSISVRNLSGVSCISNVPVGRTTHERIVFQSDRHTLHLVCTTPHPDALTGLNNCLAMSRMLLTAPPSLSMCVTEYSLRLIWWESPSARSECAQRIIPTSANFPRRFVQLPPPNIWWLAPVQWLTTLLRTYVGLHYLYSI